MLVYSLGVGQANTLDVQQKRAKRERFPGLPGPFSQPIDRYKFLGAKIGLYLLDKQQTAHSDALGLSLFPNLPFALESRFTPALMRPSPLLCHGFPATASEPSYQSAGSARADFVPPHSRCEAFSAGLFNYSG